jgi:chromosome segregation ATPase
MKWLVLGACCIVVLALAFGWGARGEVAKDKLKARIDAILGKMDVQRKEVELGIKGLKEGIDGLRRAKIRAQVSGEQIARQAQPYEDRLANMDSALKTLRGHLEANKPVELAGKTYSSQELKEMASSVLNARKVCSGQLDGLHQAQGRLKQVASALERKQTEAQTRLVNIEGQVAVIDTNRIALTAMQQSADLMGENDGNLAKGLDHLQEKVNGLFVDVETQIRVEDEKWAVADATKQLDTVDALVAKIHPSDPKTEIDKIIPVAK